MARKPEHSSSGSTVAAPDVLILHGRSMDKVRVLADILNGIGIATGWVEDLPAHGQNQTAKVDHYIRSCKVALVLLTPDETRPGTNTIRANAVSELTLCHEIKPKDTIVVYDSTVEYPTNLRNQMVEIPFASDRFHEAIPTVLRELLSRDLRGRITTSTLFDYADVLDRFMDQMNDLWRELDAAWDKIYRKDPATERELSLELDSVFVCFWKVLERLVKSRPRPTVEEFSQECSTQFRSARDKVSTIWAKVADWLVEQCDALARSTKRAYTKKDMDILSRAKSELKQARSGRSTPDEVVRHVKAAADYAEQFLANVQP